MKIYPTGDTISNDDLISIGVKPLNIDRRLSLTYGKGVLVADGKLIKMGVIKTDEYRNVKKNEWYISGAIPTAYRAPNDLGMKFRIGKLIKYEEKVYTKYTIL